MKSRVKIIKSRLKFNTDFKKYSENFHRSERITKRRRQRHHFKRNVRELGRRDDILPL